MQLDIHLPASRGYCIVQTPNESSRRVSQIVEDLSNLFPVIGYQIE